jgi:histidinol-phosphate aminotransferase
MKNIQLRQEVIDLNPYIPGEQPSAYSKIIKINTNENPYPPSPKGKQAGEKVLADGVLRKYPNPTSSELRIAIADLYKIHPDEILITNGSDEAIRLLFLSILESGDRILCPEPTYSAYPVFADITLENVEFVRIPILDNLQFPWTEMKKTNAKLAAFANPNAPTGILEEKSKIIDFVANFSGYVLCDEAYIDFAPDNSSMIQEIQNYNNLLVTRTFSKSYSLAGLRVGFIAGNKETISLLNKLKDSYNVGMLDQEIAKACLLDQEYFNKCKQRLIATREKTKESLSKIGFAIPESHTNFLFAKPPKGKLALELFEKLKEKQIYVRYFSSGLPSQYLRISIGTEEEMETVVDTIRQILA